MSAMWDEIGRRGDALATLLLLRSPSGQPALFLPQFLGEKHPTIDFFVELAGVTDPFVPYFLVQVKATSRGYTPGLNHLKAKVSEKDLRRLVAYPAPRYILGIDDPGERGYIVAARTGGPKQFSSLPTRHSLDRTTCLALFDEVLDFWTTSAVAFSSSRFV